MNLSEFTKHLMDAGLEWSKGPGTKSMIRHHTKGGSICPICAVANHLKDTYPNNHPLALNEYTLEAYDAGEQIGLCDDDIALIVCASDGQYTYSRLHPDAIRKYRKILIKTLQPKSPQIYQ